jgi:hypothetical protein
MIKSLAFAAVLLLSVNSALADTTYKGEIRWSEHYGWTTVSVDWAIGKNPATEHTDSYIKVYPRYNWIGVSIYDATQDKSLFCNIWDYGESEHFRQLLMNFRDGTVLKVTKLTDSSTCGSFYLDIDPRY